MSENLPGAQASRLHDHQSAQGRNEGRRNAYAPRGPFRAWIELISTYAWLGLSSALLLAIVELVDLNVQLTPIFQSFAERAAFAASYGVDLLLATIIGGCVGLAVAVLTGFRGLVERFFARLVRSRAALRLASGFFVSAIAALVLNQQLQIHRYVKGLIREAEKFPALTHFLLNHERATSYLIVMALVLSCGLLIGLVRACRERSFMIRAFWLLILGVLIAGVYHVDSRVEVQLYDHSLHYSMFLLNCVLSAALVASIWRSAPRAVLRQGPNVIAAAVILGLTAFTLLYFDRDQNLKTQIFYRTTQAKQYIQLLQWVLDYDRDTYSPYLGGGDLDDRNRLINPGSPETIGDGIDNNCIGGDLSQADLETWRNEWASLHRSPDPSAERLNVIFIFIDALRADHLGTYGYHRNTSPNIDRLASRSAVFENGFTPAPNTFEALPKFMQSHYWDAHLPAWSEIFAQNGYESLLFPRRISTLLRHVKGMRVVRGASAGSFEETIDIAIRVLDDAPPERPFCAYLYSTDPHRPYEKHDRFDFGSSAVDLYDGEIAYADYHLGRLFHWLEETQRLKRTMIVIMADHGESLGERSVYRHSTQVYNEQMRVPMIIHLPTVAPRRVRDYVSTIDLGATMLNAVGLEYPADCAGVSLVPLMKGEAFSHPPVFGEQTNQEVSRFVQPEQYLHPESKKYMLITQDGYKLIYNRNYYTFELYDLKSDPGEERNLYDRLPDRAARMRALLGRFIDVVTASRPWDADETQYRSGLPAD